MCGGVIIIILMIRLLLHLYEKCVESIAVASGGERWVLKSPQHMEQLPVLLKTFLFKSVVLTHRDPVAVVASM